MTFIIIIRRFIFYNKDKRKERLKLIFKHEIITFFLDSVLKKYHCTKYIGLKFSNI